MSKAACFILYIFGNSMEHYMVPVCIVGTLYNTLNHDFNFLMYNIVHLVVYLSRVVPSIVYNQML